MSYDIGILRVFHQKRGVNRAALACNLTNKGMVFTKAADKIKIEEDKKRAVQIIPITALGFRSNGITRSTFDKWIKSMVFDILGNSKKENYSVDDYQVLRNQLK